MWSGRVPAEASSSGAIASVDRFVVKLPCQSVWERISEVSEYRRWWSWLRRFDATALASGEAWQCVVQPPVPYVVRFTVALCTVEAPTLVRAEVTGDVVGDAVLTLSDTSAGALVTLRSNLAPGNSALRLVSRVARPIARYGHDAVMSSGIRSFIEQMEGDRPAAGGPSLAS